MTTFEAELNKKASKTDLEKMAKTPHFEEERFKKLTRGVQEVQDRLNMVDDIIDKRIQRLKRDLDLNVFIKQLKSKADEEKVQKGFENVDSKFNAIAETLQLLKKELDQSSNALQRISSHKQTVKFNNDSTCLLTTKTVTPSACLSCGHSASQNNSTVQVKPFKENILLIIIVARSR